MELVSHEVPKGSVNAGFSWIFDAKSMDYGVEMPLEYLQQCALTMADLATNPLETQGSQRFIDVLADVGDTDVPPPTPLPTATYPILNTLNDAADTELAREFSAIADRFPWKPSTRTGDNGTETVICELNDFLPMGDLWAGITMVAPGCGYPRHDHPPQELYLILSGQAWWRYGGSQTEVPVPAGSLIYNPPGVVHSMRCVDEPLLALWFLW
jgi:mannose-6-phosphate isomerase-like protein (cupin superfamily)